GRAPRGDRAGAPRRTRHRPHPLRGARPPRGLRRRRASLRSTTRAPRPCRRRGGRRPRRRTARGRRDTGPGARARARLASQLAATRRRSLRARPPRRPRRVPPPAARAAPDARARSRAPGTPGASRAGPTLLPSRAGHPALLAETGPPPHPAPWHPSLGACSGVAAHAYPRRRVVRAGEVVEWRGQRARVRPRDADLAELVPLPGSPPLSAAFVRRCADTLVGRGFREIVTGALAPQEAHGFVDAGFERREHLCLLVPDLGVLAAVDDAHVELIRKPRRTERPAVLAVDALAFQPFWRIDDRGLDDAAAATPVSRFRVAGPPPRAGSVAGAPSEGRRAELAAYAISG